MLTVNPIVKDEVIIVVIDIAKIIVRSKIFLTLLIVRHSSIPAINSNTPSKLSGKVEIIGSKEEPKTRAAKSFADPKKRMLPFVFAPNLL